MTCKRQICGQQASCSNRLHKIVNGTHISFAIRFKIDAGIWSGPVAFDSSRDASSFSARRERKTTISSSSISARPKKRQPTPSASNCACMSKILAKRFALSFGSLSNAFPSRNGGIEDYFPCLDNKILFNFHHSLLSLERLLIFVRSCTMYLSCSSFSTRVHLARSDS